MVILPVVGFAPINRRIYAHARVRERRIKIFVNARIDRVVKRGV